MKLKILKYLNKLLFLLKHYSLHILINLYFLLTLAYSLDFQTRFWLPIGLVQLILLTIPVLYRKIDNKGHFLTARYSAMIAYNWMGFLFLYIFTSIITSIGITIVKMMENNMDYRSVFPISFGLTIFFMIYGVFEASHIRVRKFEFQSEKISRNYSIVQISDVHLSPVTWESRINTMINKIKDISPDIIVSSGDLVDGNLDRFDHILDELSGILPFFGKYAVTGNHEFYNDLEKALKNTEKAGFEILHDNTITIGEDITIIGLDDSTIADKSSREIVEKDLMDKVKDKETYKILLKHRPFIEDENLGLFDIQLSGHTHRGLIYPLNYIVGRAFKYDHGLYNLPKATILYVSNGVGTWGPSFRFLAPPEITHIRLISKIKADTNE